MIFGYLRVSTEDQTVENQRLEIQKFAARKGMQVDSWCEETISSTKPLNKRKVYSLIESLRKGDVLIVSALSRIARKLFELLDMLVLAMNKGIMIYAIQENYELGDNITSKVMAFAFGLAAEIERNLISERTKAGLARVKASGVMLGRPKGAISKKQKLTGKSGEIVRLMSQGISMSGIARIMGVHRLTVAEWIEKYGLKEKAENKKAELAAEQEKIKIDAQKKRKHTRKNNLDS